MHRRAVAGDQLVFPIAADFAEQLLIVADLAERVQRLAGGEVAGFIGFSINVDADLRPLVHVVHRVGLLNQRRLHRNE